ncbi:MAG: hypothetical protein KGI54_18355, partial [Pseudomonadota bacterium]|nr:hypothetical protein [Pseudomonadota bacterium]
SSGQRFAIRLPSDSQSPAKPLPSANSSPCRASRGLPPPSECALPGAPKENVLILKTRTFCHLPIKHRHELKGAWKTGCPALISCPPLSRAATGP